MGKDKGNKKKESASGQSVGLVGKQPMQTGSTLTRPESDWPVSMAKRLAGLRAWQLVLLLLVVVGGVIIFVGAVSGWFGASQVTLDTEYYCDDGCDQYMIDLSSEEYDDLVAEQKSFVIFVDQSGCTTADRLEEFMMQFAKEKGIKFYRMMFQDLKETSLHDQVKYYPSAVVVSRGKVAKYLRADSNDDADEYNNYDAFRVWLGLVNVTK